MLWRASKTKGRIVSLPRKGKALIVSDLHGHVGDWRAFCSASGVLERLRGGDDVWLVVTGDVPDVARHRTVDPSVPPDGDVTILEELMRLKRELGARGERVVYLEGNHDFHLARLAREIVRYHAGQRGGRMPSDADLPTFTEEEREQYFAYYRETYGDAVFVNNIGPYDMILRVQPEHVQFIDSTPVLAVAEHAGVVVTHAGPPRMKRRRPAALKKEIDQADRAQLRRAPPEDYYDSVYHQLLNNRFRNGDYDLGDLGRFLEVFKSTTLVAGHTPHPYLIDFDLQQPLEGCRFVEGVGMIGGQQLVLCTSFGAFHPRLKRYLEVDLAQRHPNAEALLRSEGVVRSVYADPASVPEAEELPGIALVDEAGQGRG
ncbi:MAG: metallophosphoesterase [Planctomycetes bacterium]|nr:metallophosphoesterase [Planctomycetota bacterium]